MSDEQRRERVRAWALNKEREKYGFGEGSRRKEGGGNWEGLEKGSSEDVWEKRRWKVRGAFGEDWGILEREARERAEFESQKTQEVR